MDKIQKPDPHSDLYTRLNGASGSKTSEKIVVGVVLIAVLMFVLLVVSVYKIVKAYMESVQKDSFSDRKTIYSLKTDVTRNGTGSDNIKSTPPGDWLIIRNTDGTDTIIGNMPGTMLPKHMLKWQNYFIYGYETEGDVHDIRLSIMNITTGENGYIFEKELTNQTFGEFQLLNDTLFFSIRDSVGNGEMYTLALPPKKTASPLSSVYNDRLTFMAGQYWLVGRNVDGCNIVDHYALLNVQTLTANPVVDSYVGCQSGEKFIAVDKSDRVITTFRNVENGVDYTHLRIFPFTNPKLSETIPLSQIAQPVYDISYVSDNDSLLLTTEAIYLSYDLKTKKVSGPLSLPHTTPIPDEREQYQTVEEKFLELHLPPEYSLLAR